MPNTYTQVHIQAVFAVKFRRNVILPEWKNDLFKYMTGIVTNNGHKLLQINGVADHVHVFFGQRPTQALSDLMKDLKGASSAWINKNKLAHGKFAWQSGFGAFSYCKKEVPKVINYIKGQEEHHKKVSFNEEYIQLLEEFQIDYDNRFLFHPLL